MSQPAPVLTLSGTIHHVAKRHVRAVEARPALYDDQGNFLKPAVEARDAYDTYDVTVLSEGGGFLTLVLSLEALENLGGVEPERGQVFAHLPIRTYRRWDGPEGRRYTVTGYSAASELVRPDHLTTYETGSRLSAAV